jgi:hypothetical protein
MFVNPAADRAISDQLRFPISVNSKISINKNSLFSRGVEVNEQTLFDSMPTAGMMAFLDVLLIVAGNVAPRPIVF